ncbi:MAG: hypothetical protein LBC72_01420, partial [Spirochaetaceae bacterium]|nr:hypothetical protein [Spirochaetaceae bacterium]
RQDLLFTAGVLPCAGVIALVFFAAFLFSAVLRFTLFIIISFMVISVVYFYRIGIGFDNVRAPIALVEYDGEDAVSIEGAYNPARIFSPGSAERQRATLFYDRRYTGMIKYALCFVTAGKAVPVFGGQKRVILLSVSVEQMEPGRTIQVFWTKPMEETVLGSLLRGNTELLNSASERVFRVSGKAFMEMQIIYGRAKIPAGKSGGASRLVLQNFYDHWRENWLDVESAD